VNIYPDIYIHIFIKTLNSENYSFKAGTIKFFDLTKREFSNIKLNLNLNLNNDIISNSKPSFDNSEDEAPSEWDWRDHGLVGKVQDVGTCETSWANAILGNLKALYALHFGTYEYFSPQMLIYYDNYYHSYNGIYF